MTLNATSAVWPLRSLLAEPKASASGHKLLPRQAPVRTRTFSQSSAAEHDPDEHRGTFRCRHKSVPADELFSQSKPVRPPPKAGHETPRTSSDYSAETASDTLTNDSAPSSPSTTVTDNSSARSSVEMGPSGIAPYDFSRVDYQLERAKLLGQGLWSHVYLAEHKNTTSGPRSERTRKSSSPRSRNESGPSLYAVKIPARRDAKDVLDKEAKVLTYLQNRGASSHHIVPFYGLDPRNDSLVFEAVIGGSLENLISRLKQMTELARHLEIVTLFPSLIDDLVSGLDFVHAAGVVHADIKPANVLLDISHHPSSTRADGVPFIRARYIDFSAAFIPSHATDPRLASSSNAGGTWEYMAPEQLRIQKDLNTPTPASDVWSLGVTLLAVLVGGSPFADAVAPGNLFMLREAVKTGDPLGFARADPVARKRLAACQDFVDCLRLALKKDRDIRVTAANWTKWTEERELGVH